MVRSPTCVVWHERLGFKHNKSPTNSRCVTLAKHIYSSIHNKVHHHAIQLDNSVCVYAYAWDVRALFLCMWESFIWPLQCVILQKIVRKTFGFASRWQKKVTPFAAGYIMRPCLTFFFNLSEWRISMETLFWVPSYLNESMAFSPQTIKSQREQSALLRCARRDTNRGTLALCASLWLCHPSLSGASAESVNL